MNNKKKISLIFFIIGIILFLVSIKQSLDSFIDKKLKKTNQEIHLIRSMIEATSDITQLRKATGGLRISQNVSATILKRFDKIAKEHNVKYWLDWGTLLGAVRHKGFIPWDDDIDIAMEREDFEKIIPILEKEFENSDYKLLKNGLISLQYKDAPANIDIFPFDKGYSEELIEGKEYKDFQKNMQKIRKFSKKYIFKAVKTEKPINNVAIRKIYNMRDSLLLNNKKPIKNGFLFYGVETGYSSGKAFGLLFKYSDIFPLRKITFEGMEFYAPNDIDYYLYSLYNDYMSFPDSCEPIHKGITKRLNRDNYKKYREFINIKL